MNGAKDSIVSSENSLSSGPERAQVGCGDRQGHEVERQDCSHTFDACCQRRRRTRRENEERLTEHCC